MARVGQHRDEEAAGLNAPTDLFKTEVREFAGLKPETVFTFSKCRYKLL